MMMMILRQIMATLKCINGKLQKNKLASLEATQVRNSAQRLTHSLTDGGKV